MNIPLRSHQPCWLHGHSLILSLLCAPPATRVQPPDNPCPASSHPCGALEADFFSESLGRLCLSLQMAGLLVAPAGQLNCFAMQQSTSPWMMAAAEGLIFGAPPHPPLELLLSVWFAAALHCFRPCQPNPQKEMHPGRSQPPALREN